MEDLSGKVLVDCTNPLLPGLAGLAIGTTTSAAEEIAKVAPNAKVVKCFTRISHKGGDRQLWKPYIIWF
ncbi:MAG: hypothetical protein AB4426_26690 [Xenococcaceae cyanobacterium]